MTSLFLLASPRGQHEDDFFHSMKFLSENDFVESQDFEVLAIKACFGLSFQTSTSPCGFLCKGTLSSGAMDPTSSLSWETSREVPASKRQKSDSQPFLDTDSTGFEGDADSNPPEPRSEQHASSRGTSSNSGESRLRVSFSNYGQIGEEVQRFGKSGYIIPDGLSGLHEIYDQPWMFKVTHNRSESGQVLITYTITNCQSGTVTSLTETPKQAVVRELSGRTICNRVVKMALILRAEELTVTLNFTTDANQRQTLQASINALRPRLCTVGLLFFGLLHESVQKYHNNHGKCT